MNTFKKQIGAFLISIILLSCAQQDSNTTAVDSTTSPAMDTSRTTQTTLRHIHLILDRESPAPFDSSLKTSADSAFYISNTIFNSEEFQDSIRNLSFRHSSYCKTCKKNVPDNGQRISGTTVLDSLFKEDSVVMTMNLQKSGSGLGSTCPGQYYTNAYYENIKENMKELPFAYALAVNLCHEYMHQVGFCHLYGKLNEPNNTPDMRYINDDVSYRVGWIAYYLVVNWVNEKKKIF
jgi:hypothetical protein